MYKQYVLKRSLVQLMLYTVIVNDNRSLVVHIAAYIWREDVSSFSEVDGCAFIRGRQIVTAVVTDRLIKCSDDCRSFVVSDEKARHKNSSTAQFDAKCTVLHKLLQF